MNSSERYGYTVYEVTDRRGQPQPQPQSFSVRDQVGEALDAGQVSEFVTGVQAQTAQARRSARNVAGLAVTAAADAEIWHRYKYA